MNKSPILTIAAFVALFTAISAQADPTTQPSPQKVGERVPSEDPILRDFHSLGLIDGRVDIFRCASPVRELGTPTTMPSDADHQSAIAQTRIHHLYDLGIRTIICLEDPNHADGSDAADVQKSLQLKTRIALEKSTAESNGISFIDHPMNNAGPNSLEYMTDAQVQAWLDLVSADILQRARPAASSSTAPPATTAPASSPPISASSTSTGPSPRPSTKCAATATTGSDSPTTAASPPGKKTIFAPSPKRSKPRPLLPITNEKGAEWMFHSAPASNTKKPASDNQARLRRQRASRPTEPIATILSVAGSGTAA